MTPPKVISLRGVTVAEIIDRLSRSLGETEAVAVSILRTSGAVEVQWSSVKPANLALLVTMLEQQARPEIRKAVE